MKLLITGGTGFVGRHLVPLLLARGHEVHLLVRNPQKLDAIGVAGKVGVVKGDLFASVPFPAELNGVIHLAALTKAVRPADLRRVNVDGTRALLDRLNGQSSLQAFVCMSSLAAAGPSHPGRPHGEEDPSRPVSAYGRSKLEQERVVEAMPGPRAIIARAPIVYGEGDLDMLDAMKIVHRGWLLLLGRTPRTYSAIYAGDLATGLASLVEGDVAPGRYYLTHPEPFEWEPFMRLAADIMNRKPHRLTVPLTAGWLAAAGAEGMRLLTGRAAIFSMDKFHEMRHPAWVCSGEKMRLATGFVPRVPHRQALEAAVSWYLKSGLL